MNVPAKTRREIVRRASGRCEYCGLSQAGQEAVFHVDHIHPLARGGSHGMENLALACVSCSLRKGAKLQARDPVTGNQVPIFHPRKQTWSDHFALRGNRIKGLSPSGRATVEILKINRPLAIAIRAEERLLGRWPPAP